jgi:hypothetical protein
MSTPNTDATPIDGKIWKLTLYKAGDSPSSIKAETQLLKLCNHYLNDRYQLTVVDIRDRSAVLPPDILAAPTVVRTILLSEKDQ